MSIRTIEAPGVEIKEIDKSGYTPAMTGTRCYVMGYADKGEPYQPMEFTSKASWQLYYGDPDNEAERYFYNACSEVINQNGVLYCARIPYDNAAKNKMVSFGYTVKTGKSVEIDKDGILGSICDVDSSIKSYIQITNDENPILEDTDSIDAYKTGEDKVATNKIVIVDKTCATLGRIQEDTRKSLSCQMLGIFPVITTAANALYAQSMITLNDSDNISAYQTVTGSNTLTVGIAPVMSALDEDITAPVYCAPDVSVNVYHHNPETTEGGDTTEYDVSCYAETNKNMFGYGEDLTPSIQSNILTFISGFTTTDTMVSGSTVVTPKGTLVDTGVSSEFCNSPLSSDIVKQFSVDNSDDDSISFEAAQYFPTIQMNSTLNGFDTENLKKIGVVVFKAYLDAASGNKVNFQVLESFVGSLDKDAKNPNTGVSTFIDKIVNTNSQYIYLFSNCFNTDTTKTVLDNADIMYAVPGKTGMLGFLESQTAEEISLSSLYTGIDKCFKNVEDINERDIDIIPDAGLANIAQYMKSMEKTQPAKYDMNDMAGWKCESKDDVNAWKTVLFKYDNFCKNVRKDCMFIADCPRPLVLQGSKKIVRASKPSNTIDANILPKVKYITGLNTNYGAGYMDWFKITDEFTGDEFWCPPSIKAMGVYINTDLNYEYWDAPAGLNRGIIQALDVSFSPTSKQAGSIYQKNWNYAINYPNDGIVLEGQKTFQVKPSAFDRVNVRRLFLRLERQTYKVARYFVYEGNTAYTRQRLVDMLDPIFYTAKVGGGVYDYKIICDESINTANVIDNNELRVKIGIKPVKTAEFILIDFIALSTGGSFSEM